MQFLWIFSALLQLIKSSQMWMVHMSSLEAHAVCQLRDKIYSLESELETYKRRLEASWRGEVDNECWLKNGPSIPKCPLKLQMCFFRSCWNGGIGVGPILPKNGCQVDVRQQLEKALGQVWVSSDL